ncbi:hypothetical protein JXR93_05775 [bacterium]|nr:hypothetical protein [bacterium]
MRYIRVAIFTILNITLYFLFEDWYKVSWNYFFGELVFIPFLPKPYIYFPIIIFQTIFQVTLLLELILKKFWSRKLSYGMVIPIAVAIMFASDSPYNLYKKTQSPATFIKGISEQIRYRLEEYRVKNLYYPKTEEEFKNITKDVLRKTPYRGSGNSVDLKFIYLFDQNEPYLKNDSNLTVPAIYISVGGSGRKFWITASYKNGYDKGEINFIQADRGYMIIEDDVLYRKKIRESKE